MPQQRITIVLNSASGRHNSTDQETTYSRAFEHHGCDVRIVRISDYESVEDAARAALSKADHTLVVAGGDGTICAFASVMLEHDRPFGIIPSGTFNYFGRSLGLPEELEAAVELIVTGAAGPVEAATINGKMFLNNASIGAYAAILQTREGIYKRWGRSRIAAYWSVVKALATFRAPLHLDVTIDGVHRSFKTPLIFIINNAFQLEQMGLDGTDCIHSGKMVVLLAPDTNRWGLFKHAAALAVGLARKQTDYTMHCGKDVNIVMRRARRPVARDGELTRMAGPFELRRTSRPLQVIMAPERTEQVR